MEAGRIVAYECARVVLEALASGVPAVVTGDGGPKVIVREGEMGFVAADEEFAAQSKAGAGPGAAADDAGECAGVCARVQLGCRLRAGVRGGLLG